MAASPIRFNNGRLYEALNAHTRDAVDHAFRDAAERLRVFGCRCAMDDRAEALVEALAVYFVASGQTAEGEVAATPSVVTIRNLTDRDLYVTTDDTTDDVGQRTLRMHIGDKAGS